MEQGLRSGNVATGMYPHDVALLLGEEGFPVVSKFPKECAFMNVGYYACPRPRPFRSWRQSLLTLAYAPIFNGLCTKMKLSPLIGRENAGLASEGFQSGRNPGPIVRPASRV